VSRSQSIRNQKNIIKNKSEIRSILKMKNEKRTLPSSSCDPHPCLAPRNRLMASESFFFVFRIPLGDPLPKDTPGAAPQNTASLDMLLVGTFWMYTRDRAYRMTRMQKRLCHVTCSYANLRKGILIWS